MSQPQVSPVTIEFGLWTAHDGKRYPLEWCRCGDLLLDGDFITFIASEADVRRRLDGWQYHCDQHNSLMWLAARLGGEP